MARYSPHIIRGSAYLPYEKYERDAKEKEATIAALRAALRDCVEEMIWAGALIDLHPDDYLDYFETINAAKALLKENE